MEATKPDVFICYHPDDEAVARDLERSLKYGFNITTNERQPGISSHDSAVKNAVNNAEFFIYVLSLASLQCEDCKAAYGWVRIHNQSRKKKIRFVLVDACRDYFPVHLPPDLTNLDMTPYNLSKPGSREYQIMKNRLVDDLCKVMAVSELGDYADQQEDHALKQKAAQIDRMAANIGDTISVGNITDAQAIAIGDNIRIVTEQYTLPPVLMDQLTRLTETPETSARRRRRSPASVLPVLAIFGIIMVVAVASFVIWAVLKGTSPGSSVSDGAAATPTILPTPLRAEDEQSQPPIAEAPELEQAEPATPTPTPLPATYTDPVGDHQMALVYGGKFLMGSEGFDLDETPIHEVYISPFYMDVYEVTVEQYAAFLIERGNNMVEDKLLLDTRDSFNLFQGADNQWEILEGFAEYPITGVTWFGANEYCLWRGARLPTEAEWEYAARGPDSLIYPWGDEPPTCDYVNYEECRVGLQPVQVVRQDKSPFGIVGLAGNAFEWVADWYRSSYELAGNANPTGPETGSLKVLRGGSHQSSDFEIRSSARAGSVPYDGVSTYGFRCVHPIEP